MSTGELLINGAFLSSLWTRGPASPDRWYVHGSPLQQTKSQETPSDVPVENSFELRSEKKSISVGQNVEAAEAPAYRRELRFTAWCFAEHPTSAVMLSLGSPRVHDVFDETVETAWQSEPCELPPSVWQKVEFTFEATRFRPTGLQVELDFSPSACIRLAAVSLHPADAPQPPPRPVALETILARRYLQRHSAETVNAIGRALVCNAHELHFQLTFPEMRAAPAVTLPQANADLAVFSTDGLPQDGFVYDVPYVSRGSAIIRATRMHHQLRDGYLAFRDYRGAILLDAEL